MVHEGISSPAIGYLSGVCGVSMVSMLTSTKMPDRIGTLIIKMHDNRFRVSVAYMPRQLLAFGDRSSPGVEILNKTPRQ